jgi:meiotically up-regulated gene 157 (Mug157) protein
MFNRKEFIQTGALLTGGMLLGQAGIAGVLTRRSAGYISQRPRPEERLFTSEAIEKEIARVKEVIADPELAWLFENCFPNTLDTTVRHFGLVNGKWDSFIITGDIDAMWLRDSSAQVYPYVPYVNDDSKLKHLVQGVINRHARSVLIDPYANAFNYDRSRRSDWFTDDTDMKLEVHERKWEVDSLCYVIRLAYKYWKVTGDTLLFDEEWQSAMRLIVKTFKEQQRKKNEGSYHFQRNTNTPTDSLTGGGFGPRHKPVGMICSMFRPSDDATTLPFLVPSNLFAVASLKQLTEIMTALKQADLADECNDLAAEVQDAIDKYAIVHVPDYGRVYAFEVDGFGSKIFMDESNMPNLVSLPYFGTTWGALDHVYGNTRKMMLSDANPYYVTGKYGEGIGSEHTPRGYIWPLSLIARAMTSNDDKEITYCLEVLKATHAGTGFMHESFNPDNPAIYTRKWFAWANTVFGELIVKIYNEKQAILKKQIVNPEAREDKEDAKRQDDKSE